MILQPDGNAIFACEATVGIGEVAQPDGSMVEVIGLKLSGAGPGESVHAILTVAMTWSLIDNMLDGLASSKDHVVAERAIEARLRIKRLNFHKGD